MLLHGNLRTFLIHNMPDAQLETGPEIALRTYGSGYDCVLVPTSFNHNFPGLKK